MTHTENAMCAVALATSPMWLVLGLYVFFQGCDRALAWWEKRRADRLFRALHRLDAEQLYSGLVYSGCLTRGEFYDGGFPVAEWLAERAQRRASEHG